jgi:hypothetical protein
MLRIGLQRLVQQHSGVAIFKPYLPLPPPKEQKTRSKMHRALVIMKAFVKNLQTTNSVNVERKTESETARGEIALIMRIAHQILVQQHPEVMVPSKIGTFQILLQTLQHKKETAVICPHLLLPHYGEFGITLHSHSLVQQKEDVMYRRPVLHQPQLSTGCARKDIFK